MCSYLTPYYTESSLKSYVRHACSMNFKEMDWRDRDLHDSLLVRYQSRNHRLPQANRRPGYLETRASIGAWKCNFPHFKEIITDRQTNQPIDQQPTYRTTDRPTDDMRGHMEFTLDCPWQAGQNFSKKLSFYALISRLGCKN